MGELDGGTALITGATSGIGLATARRFAEEGARVVITGRRQEALDKALAAIGHPAVGVRGDVSDLTDLDRLVAVIADLGTGLDVVFANAGGGELAPRGQITPEHYAATFDSNVFGPCSRCRRSCLCSTTTHQSCSQGRRPRCTGRRPSVCARPPRPLSARSAGPGRWSSPAGGSG